MKRLFITCDYAPVTGGQSAYYSNLWRDLDIRDNLLLLPRSASLKVREPGVRRMYLPAGEKWPARLFRLFLLCLYTLVVSIRFRPSEIHCGQLLVGGLNGLLLRKIAGCEYVLYVHGSDIMEFSKGRWSRGIVRTILRNSRLVIVNSSFTAGKVRECSNGPLALTIVSPGVDERFLNVREEGSMKAASPFGVQGSPRLLTIGRLVERKGHDTVIASLPYLLEQWPELRYIVAGDGPHRERLEELVRSLSLNDAVVFLGEVPAEDLPALYTMADVFVMPSRQVGDSDAEGFGIVFLEANAAGTPVVGAKTGGIPDAVIHGETGLLVDDPSDPLALAKTLESILGDKALKERLRRNGIAHARSNLWRNQREQWRKATGI